MGQMKHHRLVTKQPQLAQESNYEVWKEFLVNLTDQIIEFVFIKTR